MICWRCVDDTFVIIEELMRGPSFDHINSVDKFLEFTEEPMSDNRSIPFLDTLVKAREDNTLNMALYRKPTHMDQFLQFDRTHPLEYKLAVVCTLYHRADTVVSEWDEIQKEKDHVAGVLDKYVYPKWDLMDAGSGASRRARQALFGDLKEKKCQGRVTIPYIQSVSGEIRHVLGAVNMTPHFIRLVGGWKSMSDVIPASTSTPSTIIFDFLMFISQQKT